MGSRHLGGRNWDNAHLARCRSAGIATVAPSLAHRERKACRVSAHLSQAIAVPPTRERAVVIAHLSPTAPVAGPQAAQPLAKRARLGLCYHWHFIGFALGMCAAVLQCAPRARTNGSQMLRTWQSASKNAPATGAGCERPCAVCLPFTPPTPQTFSKRAVLSFAKFASSGPKAQPKGSVASSER